MSALQFASFRANNHPDRVSREAMTSPFGAVSLRSSVNDQCSGLGFNLGQNPQSGLPLIERVLQGRDGRAQMHAGALEL